MCWKSAVILEEYPQHLRDSEHDLAVGDIEEQSYPHPLAPFLQALSMAERTKPMPLLETALIFIQEPVEVVEQHPVENSALGMSGTINSGHSRSFSSRNGPGRVLDFFKPKNLIFVS